VPAPPVLADDAVDVWAPDDPAPAPPALAEDDVEVDAPAPSWLPLVPACPGEPSAAELVVAPPADPDVLDAVLVCPEVPGGVPGVDPVVLVELVPPVPELEPAWLAVVPEPGVVEVVDEVDVGPLVAVLVVDVAEGAGDACVVVALAVPPVVPAPVLVVADDVVDVGAGLVLADVFEELCVLELPPLTVGWTLIEGCTLGWTLIEGWTLGATLIAGSTLIVGWKLMSAMAVALGLLRARWRWAEVACPWLPAGVVGVLVPVEPVWVLVPVEVVVCAWAAVCA
jgi:hypothetical protein